MKKYISALILMISAFFIQAQVTQLNNWQRNGNTVKTNTAYIGTNDNTSLNIKSKGIQRLKIDSLGAINCYTSNVLGKNFIPTTATVVATAGVTILTKDSAMLHVIIGNQVQTIQLPNATTLDKHGWSFDFNNNTTNKVVTITDNGGNTIASINQGAYAHIILTSNINANGTWDNHGLIPSNASWGTSGLAVTGSVSSTSSISAVNFSASGTSTLSNDLNVSTNLNIGNQASTYIKINNGATIETKSNLTNDNLVIKPKGTGELYLCYGGGSGIYLFDGGTLNKTTIIQDASNLAINSKGGNGTIMLQNSVSINKASAPVVSAALEIAGTTLGFLPPRMTTTQKNAISSPAEGLVIYDTTLHKLCIYTGSVWETITSL